MNDEQTLAEKLGFSAEDARAISELAFGLIDVGNLEGAATIFIGLLEINPKDTGIRTALGMVYERQGRNSEAEAEYSLVLERNPRSVRALMNRGNLRVRRGDQGGIDDLRAAAEIDSPMKPKAMALLSAVAG